MGAPSGSLYRRRDGGVNARVAERAARASVRALSVDIAQ
jgi:hypothetical protein